MIPISAVELGAEAERLAVEVIRSGALAQGPMVERLEAAVADLVGVRHAIAVNSGTTAIVAALEVLELTPGDEVVTSPFTFAATLNAILETGATARFADIAEDDFCVDPATVAGVVSGRTRVVLPVHLYGQAADVASLRQAEVGAQVVEDGSQRGVPLSFVDLYAALRDLPRVADIRVQQRLLALAEPGRSTYQAQLLRLPDGDGQGDRADADDLQAQVVGARGAT